MNAMLELIEEIQNTLNSNYLKVALGMVLTLPDICGQVEDPKVKSVGERYSKWCDTCGNYEKNLRR